jgi:transcriptional regulator with XRE-family HTH domain/quercetin dioxygenase-like cupin family protein
VNLAIGAELRRVRVSRKLSLRSVATAVGVSASLLSQVETGKTQPSVSTLYALVNHLGISLDGLIKGQSDLETQGPDGYEDGHHGIVQRRNENPTIEMENGVVWERLADGGRVDADPLMVAYEPGSSSSVEGKMMRHDALEYGVIIEGTLTLRIENEVHEIYPGDSFSFDANRLHIWENNSAKPARGIWFVIGNKDAKSQDLSNLGPTKSGSPSLPARSAVDVLNVMGDAKTRKLKDLSA